MTSSNDAIDFERDIAQSQGSELAKVEADKIDVDVTEAVFYAEKQVSKVNSGYGWSPTLAPSGRTVAFSRNFSSNF